MECIPSNAAHVSKVTVIGGLRVDSEAVIQYDEDLTLILPKLLLYRNSYILRTPSMIATSDFKSADMRKPKYQIKGYNAGEIMMDPTVCKI